MFKLVALLSGVLFGLGMVISGMADPSKVVGFLDVAGNWDPSLAFVMGGALAVFAPAYFFIIKPRKQPVNNETFNISSKVTLDKPLLIGSAMFGLGWGIAGLCPGPVVASLGLANGDAWLFMLAMFVGFKLAAGISSRLN
ncbi:transporter [Vibrio sp. 10N.286.49.B3]|nr:transporter [Vibrio sp. 10N.286.49.B3]